MRVTAYERDERERIASHGRISSYLVALSEGKGK
jgi:hypothetical protein